RTDEGASRGRVSRARRTGRVRRPDAHSATPRPANDPRARLLLAAGARRRRARGRSARCSRGGGRRMRWATRPGCHVDRAACAWLIRRYLDPQAEFVFVEELEDVPADASAFDMRGAELGHHNGSCSFETFLARYELDDPVLWELAKIVHEADLADERFDAP